MLLGTMTLPPDHQQRESALNPNASYIVEAPAGSGKTELLTQRFLVLLALVNDAPEEIIALTFTRKAASEMRERVVQALLFAEDSPAPSKPHALKTWQLARDVLSRDAKEQWQLIKNPSRLRIQTIDSLCASLIRQMPLISGLGSQPGIIENPNTIYQQAARALIESLENQEPWFDSLSRLLLHLNNDLQKVETLFISMLAKRDQWLPYIVSIDDPQQLRAKTRYKRHLSD